MHNPEIVPALSDFGFKNLFGKGEESKDNLIFLLNEILKEYPGIGRIVSVEYRNPEHQGQNRERKSTRFDIYCRTEDNRLFIVEMQNETDAYIKKRLVFYMCQAVTENDSRKDPERPWNYDFPPVIAIMLCNFVDNEIDSREVNYFGLVNLHTGRILGQYVGLVILQLPLFPKEREECGTELEKIIFSLENMEEIVAKKTRSFSQEEGDFYDRIERMSHTASLTNDELHAYHQWLKVTNDDRLRLQRAEEKGIAEGMEKGIAEGMEKGIAEGMEKNQWENAFKMYKRNYPLDEISLITGLPVEEMKKKWFK